MSAFPLIHAMVAKDKLNKNIRFSNASRMTIEQSIKQLFKNVGEKSGKKAKLWLKNPNKRILIIKTAKNVKNKFHTFLDKDTLLMSEHVYNSIKKASKQTHNLVKLHIGLLGNNFKRKVENKSFGKLNKPIVKRAKNKPAQKK